MAHILFGADLSLALPDSGVHAEDPDATLGSFITGVVAADNNNYGQQHCTLALGNRDHPAGLVDYLGALPVLEVGVRTPLPSPQSYESGDTVNIPESISTQLTLLYAGTINAFDNVTANKAQIVMSFAEKSISMQATTSLFKMPMASSIQPSASYSPHLQDPMKKMQPETQDKLITAANLPVGERHGASEDSGAQELAALLVPCQAIVPTALPIARKASLARFLEKRKERVRLMAPYLAKGSAQGIIHQGEAHHSNASPLHEYYNEFWGGPNNAKKLNQSASAFEFGNIVTIEDKNWFASAAENSKQASECESAT